MYAVLGGFQTKQKLNSRSYFSGITSKFKLEKGDILPLNEEK